jgi:iron complex transport system permease protein
MQALFRNPLAGPYVLGVSSGASLFVALAIMAGDIFLINSDFFSEVNLALAAGVGAAASLLLILIISEIIKEPNTVLIIGLMFGHLTGAVVTILQYFTEAKKLQGFVMWGMGSFSNVVWNQFWILLLLVFLGSAVSIFLSKSLNAYLLGDTYAESIGLNIKRTKLLTITSTALLAGGVTAFCGPIAFLGMAVPHLAKSIVKTSDHTILIPLVALIGGILAIFCDIVAGVPFVNSSLPINAVTSIVGAPVVIWVIIQKRYRH